MDYQGDEKALLVTCDKTGCYEVVLNGNLLWCHYCGRSSLLDYEFSDDMRSCTCKCAKCNNDWTEMFYKVE